MYTGNRIDKVVRDIQTNVGEIRERATGDDTNEGNNNDVSSDTTLAPSTVDIGETSCEQIAEVSATCVAGPAKTCHNRSERAYSLSKDHITPKLKEELNNLKRFYLSAIKPYRQGQDSANRHF